jgi:hypothetical protein
VGVLILVEVQARNVREQLPRILEAYSKTKRRRQVPVFNACLCVSADVQNRTFEFVAVALKLIQTAAIR